MDGSAGRSVIFAGCVLAAVSLLTPFTALAQQARPAHPLDALTGAELHQVKEILSAAGKLGPKARFHTVDLDEPDKAEVTAWRPGSIAAACRRRGERAGRCMKRLSTVGWPHDRWQAVSGNRPCCWRK
jgi:primary-amine oxidase